MENILEIRGLKKISPALRWRARLVLNAIEKDGGSITVFGKDHEQQLLILDEATSGLDPVMRDEVIYRYGVLHGKTADFEKIDPADILAFRKQEYEWQVLVAVGVPAVYFCRGEVATASMMSIIVPAMAVRYSGMVPLLLSVSLWLLVPIVLAVLLLLTMLSFRLSLLIYTQKIRLRDKGIIH